MRGTCSPLTFRRNYNELAGGKPVTVPGGGHSDAHGTVTPILAGKSAGTGAVNRDVGSG